MYAHPWFVATLFDTYFAFLTFYVWLAYKETGLVRRLVWLIAILLLGNIAMAAYLLWKLFQLRPDAGSVGYAGFLRVRSETTISTMNPNGIVTMPGWLNGTQAISSASLAA